MPCPRPFCRGSLLAADPCTLCGRTLDAPPEDSTAWLTLVTEHVEQGRKRPYTGWRKRETA